jgi:DMSO/TMAO reductase YedYZ molybdopterin-dependent catalytic subunit
MNTLTRRDLMRGAAAAGGLVLTGCGGPLLPPTYGSLLGVGEAVTFASHRLLLPGQSLAREFSRDMISVSFPAINTIAPEDEEYQRLRHAGFADWRLPVGGLVRQPVALSLVDLRRMQARTQITQHNCEQGWSAIAEWTGVPLRSVLEHVGLAPAARYIVFHCVDGWWDSLDMLDALHPQTLLTYAMNGRPLPMKHGAPVRLRVERQLGYKSLKFVNRVTVVATLDGIETGTGAMVTEYGYSWYAGI